MTWTIPPETVYSLKRGDQGIAVWATQKAVNIAIDSKLILDGVFAGRTEKAVRNYQTTEGLFVDGVFGPASSKAMVETLESKLGGLPKGLVFGLVEHESSDYIAAVGWAVAGGVDCSYVQRRVYDNQFHDDAAVQRAWNGPYQFNLLATRLKARHNVYLGMAGAPDHEQAWRLAALYHNYQSGADIIAANGQDHLSQYWYAPQSWVTDLGVKFPDGEPVRTPLEWAQHYSLGAPEHNDPGQVAKYVTDWNP